MKTEIYLFFLLCAGLGFGFIVVQLFNGVVALLNLIHAPIRLCIRNLFVASLWKTMPIEELYTLWRNNSRHGYKNIRKNKYFQWVARRVLVKRIRKYRKIYKKN